LLGPGFEAAALRFGALLRVLLGLELERFFLGTSRRLRLLQTALLGGLPLGFGLRMPL
jgi:hypothetical protein